MAAVLALILLPVIAAIGFMFLSNGGGSPAATGAMLVFAMLAIGVFASIFKMARRWEDEPT